MLNQKKKSIEDRNARNGFLFILPWICGVTIFFIFPLVKSFVFAFCNVELASNGGFEYKFNNFENFKYFFMVDTNFVNELKASLTEFLYSLPIIGILSLIFALILNQNFRGRLFARALFFMPVIIASGVVITLMNNEVNGQPVGMSVTGEGNSYTGGMIDFQGILTAIGFPESVNSILTEYIEKIFDLIWSIGVQVILFISGLQTIPVQLYEVSKVEGASKWEEFWFITVPMLKDIILLVMAYTALDLFSSSNNAVMKHALNLISLQVYDQSSTMLWIYFAFCMIIVGVLFMAYKKYCLKRWE